MSRSRYQLAAYTADNGTKVRSKLECRVLNDLDRRGFKYEYEPQPPLKWVDEVRFGECLACGAKPPLVVKNRTYLPDIRWPSGEYMEVKGLFTAEDRRTLLGVRANNPGVVIRILFMRDGWLSRKSKANQYSDWAYKNGFDYAIGEGVPTKWTNQYEYLPRSVKSPSSPKGRARNSLGSSSATSGRRTSEKRRRK